MEREASYSGQVMITSSRHFIVGTILFTLICVVVVIEQLCYLKKKRVAPGPSLVVPFLGSVATMLCNPTKYWNDLAAIARSSGHGFSANYLLGRFIVFIQDTELSQKVFTNVKPDAFMCIGHPFGKKLFGEHNLIYLFGEEHKNLRRQIAPNFSLRALSTYLSFQQRIIAQHISNWISMSCNGNKAIPLRLLCRQMNLETSQTVFVGPYLSEEGMKEAFNKDYNIFNVGLLSLPIDLPGFAFRNAQTAVRSLVNCLTRCVTESKTRMASKLVEPTCLVDFWMQDIIRSETEESRTNNAASTKAAGDSDIGGYLFDFLFAAQDASTSSLLWAVTLLESHPDVLAKVRSEVSSVWSPDSGKPLSFDDIVSMKYTKNVAREIVRFRPPATLMTHLTMKDFPLTDYYTIPKGTIVFPSVFESSFQGFTEPERFDPDRFSEERQEDRLYKRNFLSFGAGPHQCVGQRYAIHHLVVFIAMFVSLVDFKRHRSDTTTTTSGYDDIVYQPTICPRDDCTVYLSQRTLSLLN